MRVPETLCWTCTAPGTGRCSWDRSKGNIPVRGWKAIPTTVLMQGIGQVRSYCVLNCPLYEECSTAKNKRGGPGKKTVLSDEVLERWLQLGFGDRVIAQRCGLSVSTVSQRRQRLARERRDE